MGAIKKDSYHGSLSYIHCFADHAQQKDAREARKNLEKSLWGNEPSGGREASLKREIRELDLLEEFLGFVTGEMERRLGGGDIRVTLSLVKIFIETLNYKISLLVASAETGFFRT